MKKGLFFWFAFFVLFAEIFCIKMIPVLTATFPLENTDAVMFTLTQNIDGSRDFVVSLIMGVVKSSVAISFLAFFVIAVMSVAAGFLYKRIFFYYGSYLTFKCLIVVLNVICFAMLAKTIYSDVPVIDYYVKWKDSLVTPKHSDFYIKEYVNPDSVHIEFKEKKNLILIFLESMEYNFQDFANGGDLSRNLIPEITNYIKNEQSFVPGGVTVSGMGWTMADVVAKTCGIPLIFPPSMSARFTPLEYFIPGATCLTDILIGNGYKFVVSKGANMKFSGMSDFLNTHSSPEAYGLMQYWKDERVKNDSITSWGVKDSLHYELVKDHISRISKENKPWAIWMFTVDTHTPYGFLDPKCAPDSGVDLGHQMPYVIRCASRQVDSFIKWAKTQTWYGNTTIAVMGDHEMMAAPEIVGFANNEITHYWLNFFINSARLTNVRKRMFTSLDFFPTILESMGAEIPNGCLGLGRSLYSATPTLLEKYGKDSLDRVLKKRSIEYDYFLYFNKGKK